MWLEVGSVNVVNGEGCSVGLEQLQRTNPKTLTKLTFSFN